jgi:hypothetical protein
MRRLMALVLALGCLFWILPGSSSAAKAPTDSGDFVRAREAIPRASTGVGGGTFTKASCTSDAGDHCDCAAGATCVADGKGCRCVRPPREF